MPVLLIFRFHTRLPSPAKAEPAKATSAERTESVDRVKAEKAPIGVAPIRKTHNEYSALVLR